MAESKFARGVVVEYDFTALDGSEILFGIAKKLLAGSGVELDVKKEALHLAGGNYIGGLAELFEKTGCKADARETANDLAAKFADELTKRVKDGVTKGFKTFVEKLSAAGLKIVIATRADPEALRGALGDLASSVTIHAETSSTYGNCKWDAWRRACGANDLHEILTVAVAGSGAGVKSALVAGLSAVAIVHDHVAYQDFGGADFVGTEFNAALADEVLRMLHM